MPTATDLVTDLPADFEVFGQAVDTRLKALQPGTTLGDLAYSSATANTNTRLAVGSTGNVLTVAGGVPTWAAPAAGGGMTLIATATASAASTVSFTSISTDYKQLIVVWNNAQFSVAADYWQVTLNNDTGSNYHYNGLNHPNNASHTAIAVSAGTSFGNSNSTAPFGNNDIGATEANKNRGFFMIYNADQTTGRKTVFYRNNYRDDSVGQMIRDVAGEYFGTSAISQIDFVRSGASTMTGTFRLYGVK
jgi:hypothetical protein